MRRLKTTFITSCLCLIFINAAQAAQDYNSSRSNKESGVSAPDATDTLLKEASADALSVVKTMLTADQKDGYTGDYDITVDVHVSIDRIRQPGEAASGRATGKR